MNDSKKTKELVERIAASAWPAEVIKRYGRWILRANRGITKRANSVLTIGEIPKQANWLTDIESFYEEKQIPPTFYITEVSPNLLDTMLEKNKYKIETNLSILTIESEQLIEQIEPNKELQLAIFDQVNETWMSSFMMLEGHNEKNRKAFQMIFEGIRLNKGFLALYLNDQVVAVATIAAEKNWGYISNVVVSKQYRRQGIASQLLFYLAQWALQHETENLFMQVLANNEPALQLYDKLGFSTLCHSYYRIKKI